MELHRKISYYGRINILWYGYKKTLAYWVFKKDYISRASCTAAKCYIMIRNILNLPYILNRDEKVLNLLYLLFVINNYQLLLSQHIIKFYDWLLFKTKITISLFKTNISYCRLFVHSYQIFYLTTWSNLDAHTWKKPYYNTRDHSHFDNYWFSLPNIFYKMSSNTC